MNHLRLLREEAGLSQKKLAERINLTQQKVQQYEKGTYEPDITTLKSLAVFFNTSIDYIVGHTDIRRKIEPVKEYALSEDEQSLVNRYRALLPNQRRSLTMFLDALDGNEPFLNF